MDTEAEFNESVHTASKLRVMALLRRVEGMQFKAVAEVLGISEPVLSKTVKNLSASGFVTVSKDVNASQSLGRPRTAIALTAQGRDVFDSHAKALRALLDG